VDISEGGMKLMMDEKLAVGTAVNLKISIPNSKKIAEIESDVVWSEDSKETDQDGRRFFYTGVKFSAIKEPYGNYLINYIRSIASSSDKSIIASQD
jgi:c-di-GMP-binding flagellar brake protein YcgR